MTSWEKNLQRLPDEIMAIVLQYHPLFVDYTRVYQYIKYINGIFRERTGLNRSLFYSQYLGNPKYINYEIHVYGENPFSKSKKKCFIVHQVDHLLESNCEIQ